MFQEHDQSSATVLAKHNQTSSSHAYLSRSRSSRTHDISNGQLQGLQPPRLLETPNIVLPTADHTEASAPLDYHLIAYPDDLIDIGELLLRTCGSMSTCDGPVL